MRQYRQERHNNHSLIKKNYPVSRQSSCQKIAEQPFSRRGSTASLKGIIDIDKLIDDIKITPAKNSRHEEQIRVVFAALEQLKSSPFIQDEIRTIELLMESISKKIASNGLANTRTRQQSQNKEMQSSIKRNSDVSPIKQFEDATSRIFYTNFSLKELEGQKEPQKEPLKETGPMRTPAKKNSIDFEENVQIEKLNSEIHLLEKMLKMKGISQDPVKNCQSTASQSFQTGSKPKIIIKENYPPPTISKKQVPTRKEAPRKPSLIMQDNRKSQRKASQYIFR